VARAQAQLQLATDEFNRLERLRTAAATEKEYLNARYNKASAEAALASAKAAQTAANLNLGYTKVTARIGGRVGRKLVTPGNVITGGANAPEATLLTTITSVDPIYCYVDADERAVLKYQRLARENKARGTRETRMPVQLALADETGFPHEAYVDFINNRLEAGTGTLQMRASVRNADGFFTPGLFARVRVPSGAPYRATLVADEAVGTDQAQRFVLTVDNQNAVQYRPVKIGALFEGMRVVLGVTADDRVVVNGLMQARPGMKVNPTEAPMPSRPGPAATTNPSSRPAPPPLPGSTRPTSTQPVVSGWGAPVP
jgi:multidrug efflux system membrane fusion protein